MKKRVLLYMFLAISTPALPSQQTITIYEHKQPKGFADSFIFGAEAGMRIRLARLEAELKQEQVKAKKLEIETQQALLKKQLTKAEQDLLAEIKEFARRRPDWKTYEPGMIYWAAKIVPAEKTNMQDYLEALYMLGKVGSETDNK